MVVRPVWGVVAAVVVGGVAAAVEWAGGGAGDGAAATVGGVVGALTAGGLAVLVAALALTLPGIHPRGLFVGGGFVLAGIASWTYMERPLVVWAVLAVEGVVFLLWAWPWLAGIRMSPRLGSAWLGVAYWLLGIVGAVLMLRWEVAGERVAYAGVFALAVLAVLGSVRRRAAELSVGVAAAFLLALAALLLSGAGNLFSDVHVVPDGPWGRNMELRFWGGEWLLYHPNSMAGIAVLAAIRIGPDPAFARWQRLAVTVLAGAIVYVTNSRTGLVFLAAAGAVHAVLLGIRHFRRAAPAGLADHGGGRATLVAAATPFAVLALVLVLSGGQGFLFQQRYDSGGVTSGRLDTWKQVGREWQDAGPAEKLFGDTATTRAVVKRASSGDDIALTTDNAAVGALRRGGVSGVAAFLLGLGLLLWRTLRWLRRGPGGSPSGSAAGSSAPAWLVVAVVAGLPTIATTDWLLGGTGGTFWALLLAGEAWLVFRPAGTEITGQLSANSGRGIASD